MIVDLLYKTKMPLLEIQYFKIKLKNNNNKNNLSSNKS